MLGTHHYSWPDSWGAFMVSISPSGRGSSEVSVQVPAEPAPRGAGAGASARMATLAAPRLTVRGAEAGRCRLEEDLDGIWAWAFQRGYAREITARTRAGPARADSQVHDDGAAGLSSAAGAGSVAAQEASSLSASWLGEPGSTA